MSAQRIVFPDTAFSKDRQRKPRKQDGDHLAFIRSLPSLVSGKRANNEAAHVRYTDRDRGKENPGAGTKPDDCWVVPLTAEEHRAQHSHGDEAHWWQLQGIDPVPIAALLYALSGDEDAAIRVIEGARKTVSGQVGR